MKKFKNLIIKIIFIKYICLSIYEHKKYTNGTREMTQQWKTS